MTRPHLLATLLACACSGAGPLPPDAAPTTNTPAAPEAPVETPPASPTPDARDDDVMFSDERMDMKEARAVAEAVGFKGSVSVPHPIRCPALHAPPGPGPLAAKGPLATLVVDPEAFLRADVGIPEAVALLGVPALCDRRPDSRHIKMYLATQAANVRQVALEIRDDLLIGIVVDYESPAQIDIAELRRRLGQGRSGVAGAHVPASEIFEATSSQYAAYFSFGRTQHSDAELARGVKQAIYRRTARHERLPDSFKTEDDLVRLATLVLWSRAPDPVTFYGSLGVYGGEVDGKDTFLDASQNRNVKHALLYKTGTRPADTTSIVVTFAAPVPATAEGIARGLAQALRTTEPTITRDGSSARIALADANQRPRGEVVLEFAGDTIVKLTATRAP